MPIQYVTDLTKNAMGGTEIMARGLEERLDPKLLDKFNIIPSRVRELDDSRINILWLHDLPGDPESDHLKNGGYNKFEKLVFVSNWQMQNYIQYYGIPWYKCVVIENAIDPVVFTEKPTDGKINFIYHTTPHRGLQILVPVFKQLSEKYPEIHLDVYSSFKIYGWEERDKQYEPVFDMIKEHDKMTYHGSVPNSEVKKALQKAHCFAYPSIWMETSCIALIEAMSAGCLCVHPNFAALSETASRWTWMYQFHEDNRDHAQQLYGMLEGAVQELMAPGPAFQNRLTNQRHYTNMFFSWDIRMVQWDSFLRSILARKNISIE